MLSDAVQLEQNASFLPELWVCWLLHSRFQMSEQQSENSHLYLPPQAWYGVGVCCIALRYLVRIRTVGVRDFQGDDYVMFVVSYTPKTFSVSTQIEKLFLISSTTPRLC